MDPDRTRASPRDRTPAPPRARTRRRASVHALALVAALVVLGVAVGGALAIDVLDGDGLDPVTELRTGTDPLATDTDGDGVRDGRERTLGTDPTAVDSDDDGLSDGRELDLGTDATAADTDGDGLADGRELALGTDPSAADTDGDGLADGREVQVGTAPTRADTDGDGLADATELAGASDPTVADTDGDGLEDGVEVRIGTDPTLADTDEDGLSDGREGNVGTDPLDADTDGDGLEDGAELELGTSPRNADSDGDGLGDGRELEVGTDPTDPDTDGDRLQDGWEVAGETPSGAALPGADPLVMDLYVQINYGADAKRLSDEEIADVVAAFAAMPVENPDGSTGIALHVDDEAPLGGSLGQPVRVGSQIDVGTAALRYATEETLGPRQGVYHLVIVADVTEEARFAGIATTPGRFAIVDESATATFSGTISYRSRAIVHELLHNVMGPLDPENRAEGSTSHSEDGWLAYVDDLGDHEFLPEGLADEIEDDGFQG